jgi:c-di-GMP-binding flagellar brake protein YcgR
MNALIAVVVAFLSDGDMNYVAVGAQDKADCQQKVAEIERIRLDQNEQEEVKVLGFSFECIELENKSPVTVPNKPASARPKHIPGDQEA